MARKAKFRLRGLSVREVSFVDEPAIGVRFLLAKRADGEHGDALTPAQERRLDAIIDRHSQLTPTQEHTLDRIIDRAHSATLDSIIAIYGRNSQPSAPRRATPSVSAPTLARIAAFMSGGRE